MRRQTHSSRQFSALSRQQQRTGSCGRARMRPHGCRHSPATPSTAAQLRRCTRRHRTTQPDQQLSLYRRWSHQMPDRQIFNRHPSTGRTSSTMWADAVRSGPTSLPSCQPIWVFANRPPPPAAQPARYTCLTAPLPRRGPDPCVGASTMKIIRALPPDGFGPGFVASTATTGRRGQRGDAGHLPNADLDGLHRAGSGRDGRVRRHEYHAHSAIWRRGSSGRIKV